MHSLINLSKHVRRLLVVTTVAMTMVVAFWVTVSAQSTPLSPAGYLDFSFQGWDGSGGPTGEKPESKLWWNDGFWWGSLYSSADAGFRIHKLNWGTQTWENTGVALDDRNTTKADTLWDQATNKLYVVSHNGIQSDGRNTSQATTWTRLYRYSYDATAQTYSLDAGFPTVVYQGESETAVLTKGTSGSLWVTYVSRAATPTDSRDYQVYITASTDDGATWGAPFVPVLNVDGQVVHVARGDISAVVAFGNNIGVMWNNTIITTTHTLHFAYRANTNTSITDAWTHQMISVPGGADDHISIRSLQATNDGRVFAAIKTSTPLTDPITDTLPLIGMVARDLDGTISFHPYSLNIDKDTRPILLIDEGDLADATDNQVRIFVSGKEGGSKICYKSLPITFPLSGMGDFVNIRPKDCGTVLIEDSVYKNINNASSTKQNVNKTTGIVILASDSMTLPITATQTSLVYVHGILGNPSPVVTAHGPAKNATNIQLTSVVTATFSKPINQATLTSDSFSVQSASGVVPGTISYDVANRTATFTPAGSLAANTVYTVRLTNAIQDFTGLSLNAGIDAGPVVEEWTFTTSAAAVAFTNADYNVNEIAGTATITVVLDAASAQTVTVGYATTDGTAVAGVDYNTATGTLTFIPGETSKTFTVGIIDDAIQDGTKSLNLALTNPTNAILGLQTAATLIIVDDDSTTVQFNAATYSVNEATGEAVIEVTLSRAAATIVTVDYATSNGTAVAPGDYATTSGTLTFNIGELSKTFAVPVLNDGTFEGSETVNLVLNNVTPVVGATLGIPTNAVLTITDGTVQPTVKFSSATYSVGEAAGTATITATLSAPSSTPVTVNYATSNGTAIAPGDYTATSGSLTFAAGETSKTFPVAIFNDALDEVDEVINLTLSTPGNATLGIPNKATLTIVDEDAAPTVQFASGTASKGESSGAVEVIVTLNVPSGKVVTVDYASSNGSAIEGEDYGEIAGTLSFGAGETSRAIELFILDDTLPESNETINLTLSNPANATLGTPATMILTISANDGETASFKLYLPIIQK